jgi:saccharopine dehydrogenase-like NADP-dependent oxidoreductase
MAMDSDCGVNLGRYQWEKADDWEKSGHLAIVGMGVEPGMSDVFAAYAAKHLFDSIDEVGVRDGANLEVLGYDFAPNFSIWTTIEECLNPPIVYEAGRGWFETENFSEPEMFEFPEGIGTLECVNVEHEEVVFIPRCIKAGRVTFKYGLGTEFINVLKTLHMIGLDSTEKLDVHGVSVAPRDVVAACLPDPARLGDHMVGKTCAGTWIKGTKGGKPREVYMYQVADNATTMKEYGVQAVVWQTAFNPVIAMELLAEGIWGGTGLHVPESFDPDPFMERMAAYGAPYGIRETPLD